jgi:hypothetical protein
MGKRVYVITVIIEKTLLFYKDCETVSAMQKFGLFVLIFLK